MGLTPLLRQGEGTGRGCEKKSYSISASEPPPGVSVPPDEPPDPSLADPPPADPLPADPEPGSSESMRVKVAPVISERVATVRSELRVVQGRNITFSRQLLAFTSSAVRNPFPTLFIER